MRISLSDTLCGRETAKAMIWAMSSRVIAVAAQAAAPARAVRPATDEMLIRSPGLAELVEEDLGGGHRAEQIDLA